MIQLPTYEPAPLTPVIRVKLALRSAGLDWWTAAEASEREQLIWVESSIRPGLVWLRPLFDCYPAGLQLPFETALEVLRWFAIERDEIGRDGVDATLAEAQALWDRLVLAAEGAPSDNPPTIEVP